MEAPKLNTLVYKLPQNVEDSQSLLFHLRTASSAYDQLKTCCDITTRLKEPIPDAEAFLGHILYEDSTVRVVHPILGGRWDLSRLSEAARSWSRDGDNTCDTCRNRRLRGKQQSTGQPTFVPIAYCSGEKKGGNIGKMPCQDYYPIPGALERDRIKELSKLAKEAANSEPFKIPRWAQLSYQVTHRGTDYERVSESALIDELRELAHDFDQLNKMFAIKDPEKKQITDREDFLRTVASKDSLLLRSETINLGWDVSELHQTLLQQEREDLVRLIDHVIQESRSKRVQRIFA